ncbi:sugar transporter [Pseudoxanthomonas indica]|nr:TonB-dependent hemoglobin/transferrin/lactoferrin family receptor [Pseudoxanthomonas indica]GGD43662.1 sugar transporter [Pseudoxanthomonas indica]
MDAASSPNEFDRVQVTATRGERVISDVPNTVSVIDREQLDDRLVRDLRELVLYEPGISVTSSFGRFGIGDIRIRGLGGNRVRVQVDGIAVSDSFSIGSFSNANRNFVDLDTLKQVEIVRGPSSSLYGSDALGGVVSFITKDPSDYLSDGKGSYFGLKLGYDGSWNGLFGGATAAFGGERWSGMVVAGHRQGQETENMAEVGGTGSLRTKPNPQERDGRSLLTKLVYAPQQDQRFTLTVEGNEDDADTNLLTSQGLQALTGANNTSVTARDHQSRARVSLAHTWDNMEAAWADHLDWQLYRQDSQTTQYTREERTLPPPTLRDIREREFDFDQRMYGLQANLRKSFMTGNAQHDLSYGLDVSWTETQQKRDGLRTFPLTGVETPVMAPDNFPVRDFPISKTTVAALYVQDEISLVDGRLRLVPGVRVDHYRLNPELDNIFAEDNPGVAVSDLNETSVSPKFGVVWHFNDDWSLFGSYARGFRSPPYNDVNIGFTNVQFGYTAIANPDLKPETSDGIELGLRYSTDAVYAGLTVYGNKYKDFIESTGFVGFNAEGLMVYQSRNIDEAKIYGAEFKGGVELGILSDALAGWSLQAAAAWSRGKDETNDTWLDSVDPLTATLGVAYDREQWGAELVGRFVSQKDESSAANVYQAPGYGVLDLYAHWDFAAGAKLNFGVLNLGDRRYFEAGNLAVVPLTTSRTLDRYTAPGRTVSASLAVSW